MPKHHKIDMPSDKLNCYVQDPQSLLLKAFQNGNIIDFKYALDNQGDPTIIDPATNKSLFEELLQIPGYSKFVEECIRRGLYYLEKRAKKAPINYATDSKDPKIMLCLLELHKKYNISVNVKYGDLTPLHSLCKNITTENYQNAFDCIKLLISYKANPNIPDESQRTPILHIIDNESLENDKKKEIIRYFFENCNIDLDSFHKGEARRNITIRFPDIQMPDSIYIESSPAIYHDILLKILYAKKENEFIKTFKNYEISEKEELHVLLVEAITNGLNGAVNVIFQTEKIDINDIVQNNKSPIELSCISGNVGLLDKLLHNEKLKLRGNENLLITVIKRLDEPKYRPCFDALLNSYKIDVNEIDSSGSSALHYAVKYKNEEAIQKLLKRGAYLGTKSKSDVLPITEINPEVLEDYLDSCITTKGSPEDDNFKIIINYTNLIPKQNVKNSAKTKRSNTEMKSEMIPIEHIAESKELRHLLEHPVIKSFLYIKWHRVSMVFYLNFILYAIFCASLVTFIILKFHGTADDAVVTLFYVLSLIGVVYMIIREILQLIISPKGFVKDIVNYLEVALIILTILTLAEPNYEKETNRDLAVFTILLSSIDLCLLVGSLPVLSISTHMLMLQEVSETFLKSFTFYSIFIVAFSLCFYILFGQPGALLLNAAGDFVTQKCKEYKDTNDKDNKSEHFATPMTAIIKTIVMFAGELSADEINFNSFVSYLVFLLFIFFVPIIIFNLLNGLAVNETQDIKSRAELNGSICLTRLLSKYERSFKSNNTRFLKLLGANIFPDYIKGNNISILPNDRNKIGKSTELAPIINNTNGNSVPLVHKFDNQIDIESEKKLLDPPVQIMPCCCSCITGKCSEMDIRTVKTALTIISRTKLKLKTKRKIEESEERLQKIEDKIEKVFALLQEMSER